LGKREVEVAKRKGIFLRKENKKIIAIIMTAGNERTGRKGEERGGFRKGERRGCESGVQVGRKT
jgi:hypothetical protein